MEVVLQMKTALFNNIKQKINTCKKFWVYTTKRVFLQTCPIISTVCQIK